VGLTLTAFTAGIRQASNAVRLRISTAAPAKIEALRPCKHEILPGRGKKGRGSFVPRLRVETSLWPLDAVCLHASFSWRTRTDAL
jgi:hypothetical protein